MSKYYHIKQMVQTMPLPKLPYSVRYEAVNSWSLNHNVVDKWFDKYYILHWDGTWLAEQVSQGVILHDGCRFRVNWITVPTVCYRSATVQLSFRRIYGQEEGYVLIKVGA